MAYVELPMSAWRGSWTAEALPPIASAALAHDDGEWVKRPGPFEFRDLGLAAATGGELGAFQIRAAGAFARPELHATDLDFELTYIVRGASGIEGPDGAVETLEAGDAVVVPPRYWHTSRAVSPDFEAVVITSPASVEMLSGRDDPRAVESDALDPGRRHRRTSDSPGAYARGVGPRASFRYRDLGTEATSDGRIQSHVVRASGPGATGWQRSTSSSWLFVLGGSSWVRVEDGPAWKLEPGAAMSIGAGTRYDLGPYSAGYAALELWAPATSEVVACEPPPGAAALPADAPG